LEQKHLKKSHVLLFSLTFIPIQENCA